MPSHKITATENGTRVDILLTQRIGLPRAEIQRWIKAGTVTVNDIPVTKPHAPVKSGDVLAYPKTTKAKPVKIVPPVLPILYEDDDVMVINKPAGIIVHPTSEKATEPTVVHAALKHFPALKKVGDNPIRPGIVHRLDKDVSGVMVIAKTQSMFLSLKQQFTDRSVKKEYLALVYGKLSKDHDIINLKIARSKSKGRMVARPESQEGKEAITEYDVLDRFKTATYVRVNIHTGRTHQIRTHFRAINHPVVGDVLYGKSHMRNIRPIPMDRLFLHSHELTITLSDGSRKTVTAPLPDSLKQMLTTLPKV